jgi:CRP/FNR family transcriptional regulator
MSSASDAHEHDSIIRCPLRRKSCAGRPEERTMATQCNVCTARKTTIFGDLNDGQLARIEKFIREKAFPKKHIIFIEEAPVESIYLIKRGTIKLYKTQPDGRSQILRIDGTGGVLGFDSLFRSTYLATAETIVESVLCQIRAADFRTLLAAEPDINHRLLKVASQELERNQNLLFTIGTGTARERLAYFLLTLYLSQCDCEQNPRKINLLISRQELSEHLGIKQETVIRNLTKLKEEKILDIKGKEIIIRNPELLTRMVEGTRMAR